MAQTKEIPKKTQILRRKAIMAGRCCMLIIFMLLWGHFASADDSAKAVPTAVEQLYQGISGDLSHDVNEMARDLKLTPAQAQKFATDWASFLKDPSLTNPIQSIGLNTSTLWPPQPIAQSTALLNDGDLTPVKLPTLTPQIPYSMSNVRTYADDRLGPNLAEAVRKKQVSVEIFGGTSASLSAEAKKDNRVLKRIPSLYEQWGIEKFLDMTPGQKPPKVVIRVPPIQQYVEHYADIINAQGGILSSATVDQADRAAYRESVHQSVDALFAQTKDKPDYVALGYGSKWAENLQGANSKWKIVSTQNLQAVDGISAIQYKLQSKANPSFFQNIFVVSNEKTMWGEGTSFVVEGILKQKPTGIFFLGSAGAPAMGIKAYDVTVPSQFMVDGKKVAATNILNITHPKKSSVIVNPGKITTRYDVIHGNTSSPIAETRALMTDDLKAGIGTVDVEQSLVASVIADHNSATGDKIQFGAANVITDKPSYLDHTYRALNLDHTNIAKKSAAQLSAVQTVLDSIPTVAAEKISAIPLAAPIPVDPVPAIVSTAAKVTDAERIDAIHKLFPKVDVAQISVINGQGKIEVDLENKFSYFIYTANPADPTSKTILIPMSTSRFDPWNYATNDWWNAHIKEINDAKLNHTPMPHQDWHQVRDYLKSQGLSTNPDVLTLDVKAGTSTRTQLKEFLLKDYITRFSDGDNVILYRGAVKENELDSWKAGEVFHGARYWTPDADYAWRYARKDSFYLQGLIDGTAPIMKFKIPKADFIRLVENNDLVLGTEITKSAHDGFDADKRFVDALTGYDYSGDGKFGLDWEIRGRRHGREPMPEYFQGATSVDELAAVRIQRIHESTDRIVLQSPDRTTELRGLEVKRVQEVNAELDVIHALQKKESPEIVTALLAKMAGAQEITDYGLSGIVDDYVKNYGAKPAEVVAASKAGSAAASGTTCPEGFAKLAK